MTDPRARLDRRIAAICQRARREQATRERAFHDAVASERLAVGLHWVLGFAPKNDNNGC